MYRIERNVWNVGNVTLLSVIASEIVCILTAMVVL